ncbi:transcriptional regulatory protein pro-1 [Fusarium pseudocircinatum]|uniref:Transcriptional regulatory protein pro-1 n=1 Tax=Fusarium pseudocircinatum TaxID=56676 RepID=A0A8H5KLY8_9HYPO|nr:transcriptional regulatory protein pro-1 [Fusarium pseudocircinatum]
MQRPEIRSRQGRTCDYTNEFRWAPVSDVFVVPDISFNGGTKRVNRDERWKAAQNRGRRSRKRGRRQDAHQGDISGQVLNQCQNETQTLGQGQSPNLGTAPYDNDSQLRSGGSEHRDGVCSRSAPTLDTSHASLTSISPATTHQQVPSLQDFGGFTRGNSDMSLYFNDFSNVQFVSNWFNAFVEDQDLLTLSAQHEDHVPAIGDGISEQVIQDTTSVHLDSVPSDGDALLEIIESEHEVARSKSGTDTAFSITKAFEHSLGPPTSSLPTCTEEIAFNYSLGSPGNPFRELCRVSISYPLLLHTFLYVSAANMYNYCRGDLRVMEERRSQALRSLRSMERFLRIFNATEESSLFIESNALSILSLREVTLAAYLIHIASEVMTGSLTTDTHLQNAFKLVVELQYIDKMPDGFYSRFLVQRFAMIDVIMSLLRRRKPLAPGSFILYQQHEEADVSGPSFRELTGCPQPVLSFLAKISILAIDLELGNDARLAQAYQLETTMRDWGSQKYPSPLNIAARSNSSLPGSPSQDDHLSTLNACFYWMAHLLLARRVFMDPTASSRVQLYRKHLFCLMDRLPPGCGPDSSLPIPFYMAAREAIVPLDREWVRHKHTEMIAIYPDRSRELMMSLTEDIWSMSDREYHDLVPKGPWDLPWIDDDMNLRMKDSQAMHFII